MTTVFVCSKCKQHKCLEEILEERTPVVVRRVACQKVCKAPVAGLEVRGRMEWFGGLDRAKPLAALVRLAQAGGKADLPRSLEKRRSGKRSGRAPR